MYSQPQIEPHILPGTTISPSSPNSTNEVPHPSQGPSPIYSTIGTYEDYSTSSAAHQAPLPRKLPSPTSHSLRPSAPLSLPNPPGDAHSLTNNRYLHHVTPAPILKTPLAKHTTTTDDSRLPTALSDAELHRYLPARSSGRVSN